MVRSNTVTVTLTEEEVVPSDTISFKILKPDETPAAGATVELCPKDLPISMRYTKVADEQGKVNFTVYDICATIGVEACKELLKTKKWLFWAYINSSEFGVWKDDAVYELGKEYTYTLKKYTTAPEFFIKFELKDVFGAELWSNLITGVEQAALTISGLKVTNIEGQGTKTVTIHFNPPWSEHSPIAILFGATTNFIIAVAILLGGIITLALVLRWSFGEVGGAILTGGALLVLGVVALAIMGKIPKREETK